MMIKTKTLCLLALAFWYMPSLVLAQNSRPVPYPVFYTPQFQAAIDAGTRTETGTPGPNYWSNYAVYEIDAVVSPATNTLRGEARITYQNNSPDNLQILLIKLYQNVNKAGSPRTRTLNTTNGVQLASVLIDGAPMIESGDLDRPGYDIDGTLMYIRLPEPLSSGESIELRIAWTFAIPPVPNSRMGQDGEVYYLAYWYPQLAVYDDVHGWDEDPYLGAGEFYMGYADYTVNITVPEGWLVSATGTLQNPEAVLGETVRRRLERAMAGDEVISIVPAEERRAGVSTRRSRAGALTWRFEAENVRDFAFGTSDRYVWDATSAEVGDLDGDDVMERTLIHAFYRPERTYWKRAAEFGQYSIEYLSDFLWPYPWPHMSIVEGLIGGGMEYPMITLIGSDRDDYSLLSVTIHEIAHMWFPMLVGSNEKTYTWMDEGLTRFNQNGGLWDFFPDVDPWDPESPRIGRYYRIAGSGHEVESMRHGDRYPLSGSARGIASYGKPALGLRAMQGIYGDEKFLAAYREYGRRWLYKHPTPYDLFNTFEDVLGEDLDWFWSSWIYETWTLDQAVTGVETGRDEVVVTVTDKGLIPMPVLLRVTYLDGRTEERKVPVDVWLEGRRQTAVAFPGGRVQKVEIDPENYLPDVDKKNNVWTGRG